MTAPTQTGFDERTRKQFRFYTAEAIYLLFQNTVLNPFERLKTLKQVKTVITPYGINPKNSSMKNFQGSVELRKS